MTMHNLDISLDVCPDQHHYTTPRTSMHSFLRTSGKLLGPLANLLLGRSRSAGI
jgi:hypothetical protein